LSNFKGQILVLGDFDRVSEVDYDLDLLSIS